MMVTLLNITYTVGSLRKHFSAVVKTQKRR